MTAVRLAGCLLLGAWSTSVAGCGDSATAETTDARADTTGGGDGGGTDAPKLDSPQADFGVCPSYPDAGTAPAECAACVDALCKDESTACAADDPCVKQVACQAACATSACQAACMSSFPSVAGKARFDCIRCRCETQCTLTTGG